MLATNSRAAVNSVFQGFFLSSDNDDASGSTRAPRFCIHSTGTERGVCRACNKVAYSSVADDTVKSVLSWSQALRQFFQCYLSFS